VNSNVTRGLTISLVAGAALSMFAGSAFAQEAAGTQKEYQYVFNTLLFLMGGFLVMWMAAGFAMLEAGMVRSKNVAMQCTKNIGCTPSPA
jgi:Amt family ammonium transporter